MLTPETRATLQRYIDGHISNAELAEWLAQAEYDSDLEEAERDALARIRLVVIEVGEKRRETPAILEAVAEVVAASTAEGPVVASRTGSTTTWQEQSRFSAAPARFQRVGI